MLQDGRNRGLDVADEAVMQASVLLLAAVRPNAEEDRAIVAMNDLITRTHAYLSTGE